MVDGEIGDANIADVFSDKYEALYNSVSYNHCRYPDYHNVRYGSHQDGGRFVASCTKTTFSQ